MTARVTLTGNSTLETADGDTDLLEVVALDDYPLKLRRLFISQGSEVGDAMEEGVRITIRRFAAINASGSGGITPTIESPDSIYVPKVTAAEMFNDVIATVTGADDVLWDGYWNVRGPLELVWPRDEPDGAPTCRGAEALIVRVMAAVGDQISCSVVAELDEG